MKYFQQCLTSAPFHLGRSSSAPAARPFTNLSAGGQVAAPCVWSCEAAFWWLHPEGSDPHGRAAASPQGGRGGAAGEALWGALCGEPHFGEQRQRATCCRDQHWVFFFFQQFWRVRGSLPWPPLGGRSCCWSSVQGPRAQRCEAPLAPRLGQQRSAPGPDPARQSAHGNACAWTFWALSHGFRKHPVYKRCSVNV